MNADTANRLRRVAVRMGRHFNATATAAGLTPSEASALGSISRTGSLKLGELVRIENLHPSVASRVVAKLVEAGLVRRMNDRDDQRSAWVEITPAGAKVQTRIAASKAAVVARAAAGLSAREVGAIEIALPALEALIERLEKDAS